MSIKLIGYHGTNSENIASIMENGFIPSKGDDEWLGDGVYFFVYGNSSTSPIEAAKKWAIASSWDNEKKIYKYEEYTVLKVLITVKSDNFFDLNIPKAMVFFNKLRDNFIAKLQKRVKNGVVLDGSIINAARNDIGLPIGVTKADFYIKFTKERKFNINFRIPNCTIAAVVESSTTSITVLGIELTGKI
jgi:hypothetical protein